MLTKYLQILSIGILLFTGCKNNEGKTENTDEEKSAPKTQLSEEALLDTVQKQTLKYFWDYAEPNSGMARERFHPDGNYPKNDAHVVLQGDPASDLWESLQEWREVLFLGILQ